MNFKDRIRGWLPKERYIASSQNQTRSNARVANIVGYGVGIGVCELLMLASYFLGWGDVERSIGSLSPALDLFANLVIVFPAVAVAMVIGSWLSKKLQERWRVKL
ncbi:MAG: hypothetical protein NWF00_01825 [Candidatus Bathyarchaeota archaeon]|nr:hypothetical protein [Candidatus Bathyarchaeota archaeon]